MLPFNAFGTMAIAREEFDPNSGSSQFFWLLKVGGVGWRWGVWGGWLQQWRLFVRSMCGGGGWDCVGGGAWPAGVEGVEVPVARSATWGPEPPPAWPQESELTPTGANLLDGRYGVFGYVTEGSQLLKEMQVGWDGARRRRHDGSTAEMACPRHGNLVANECPARCDASSPGGSTCECDAWQ